MFLFHSQELFWILQDIPWSLYFETAFLVPVFLFLQLFVLLYLLVSESPCGCASFSLFLLLCLLSSRVSAIACFHSLLTFSLPCNFTLCLSIFLSLPFPTFVSAFL